MKIKLVGTSCNWFSRLNTSFIIDDKILFDVPIGNYKTIIQNVDIFKLDWVFISHLHSDHFVDFNKIASQYVRAMLKNEPLPRLRVYAPKEMAKRIIQLQKIIGGGKEECSLKYLKKAIEFIDLKDQMEFEEGGYKMKVYKVVHGNLDTFGLTMTNKNGVTVGFSSDTIDCENLHKILENSNYAFVDMSSEKPWRTHLCYDEFVKLSKVYPSCKMFPVHTSDMAQELAEKNGLNFVKDGQVFNF